MMIKQKLVTAVLVAVGMFTASACTNTARQEQATTEPTQPTAQPSQPATGQGQSTTGSKLSPDYLLALTQRLMLCLNNKL
jgi:hypothetical protein